NAALTLLRGYCSAGRPDVELSTWGSYEAWSGLVRAAIVWAGLPDPCVGRAEFTDADADLATLRMLITGIEELGGGPLAARVMLERLESAPTLRAAFAELGEEKLSA